MFKKPLFSTVSSKGQTVIPVSLREDLCIEKGSTLFYQQVSRNTFLVRVMVEGESIAEPTMQQKGKKIPSIGLKKTY
ncbi:AbrB/MazE/SpoVT family DNA-binding domain-containing protein [Brevibacillus sp. AG]|uniref:AbrB/MazE/SpoVT family DNA-binding domain-containing protein n=1 Tax=Brevibacillus sp. AG TaxID=3020891 RepID=UPI00232D5ECD|nr:AbrB/MazE/SpoVT family DNA-binding domain-containing protein [Brevibacillus sp. AG]MDC0764933.1 AbrB/MazE/SpoVT family DNA-binding domain-containing protein [Brevibacillus sp. AG]